MKNSGVGIITEYLHGEKSVLYDFQAINGICQGSTVEIIHVSVFSVIAKKLHCFFVEEEGPIFNKKVFMFFGFEEEHEGELIDYIVEKGGKECRNEWNF